MMSESKDEEIVFRRILVALDNSRDSVAALNMAAFFARMLQAELEGLFVEEDDWYELIEHGFFLEVSTFTGTVSRMEKSRMRMQIRGHSERIRREIEKVSRKYEISHRFRSVRGKVQQQILEATKDADLITIGMYGRSVVRRGYLGSTARAILHYSTKPVLLLQQGMSAGERISLIDDGSGSLRQYLSLARVFSGKLGLPLLIINIEGSDKTAPKIVRYGNTVFYNFLNPPTNHDLSSVIREYKTGLLIAGRDHPLMQRDSLERILAEVRCPLLLLP